MVPLRRVLCAGLVVVSCLFLSPVHAAATAAEELMKRLPDNTLGFVATSGADVLRDDFAKTGLSRIWNDPGVRSFYQALQNELLAKAKQEAKDPNVLKQIDMAQEYARLVIGRPLVIGVAQVEVKQGPPLCAFAILEAGDRKAQLAAGLSKVEEMMGQGIVAETQVGSFKMHAIKESEDLPLYWGWVDNRLVVAVNDAQGVIAKCVSQPRTAAPPYVNKLPARGDAFVMYADCQRIGQAVAVLMRTEGSTQELSTLTAVIKSLGFDQVRAVANRVGFAGPDLVSDFLVEMPRPATGLLASCQPVDPAWFGAVDARAFEVFAVNVETAGIYDLIMNTVKMVAPAEGYAEIQKTVGAFETEAKVRLRGELLAALAGPVVFYSLPAGSMPEAPRGGAVALLRLKDVGLFEKSLMALGVFAGSQSRGALQIGEQKRDGGRTVHIWAVGTMSLMGIMPAWSVVKDHVVIGTTPELCDLGVKQLASTGNETKSLRDTEGYQKAAAGLPAGLVTLTYTDSRVHIEQIMIQAQQIWPMLVMGAMQAGVKLPVVLPSLVEPTRDMGPSLRYAYFDADGLHSVSRGPGMETTQMAIAGGALGMGIALPALARTRETARTMASANNLKQIGLALMMYADDNNESFPTDLQATGKYLGNAGVLESPRKPEGFSGPSYIYIPGQGPNANMRNVLVYENPEFVKEKINVLFPDGHVEAMQPEAFRQALKETYERLGRTVPEVRFRGEKEVKPQAPKASGSSQV